MAGHIIGFGTSNQAENANELSTDVTVKGKESSPSIPPDAIFQKHKILIQMDIRYLPATQNNIVSWEVKNVTDNIVIDRGTWIYGADLDPDKEGIQPKTDFWKNIIYTTNCVGDVLRLRMWLPTGRTGGVLRLSEIPNTFYS
jgi:hypothetical protein